MWNCRKMCDIQIKIDKNWKIVSVRRVSKIENKTYDRLQNEELFFGVTIT